MRTTDVAMNFVLLSVIMCGYPCLPACRTCLADSFSSHFLSICRQKKRAAGIVPNIPKATRLSPTAYPTTSLCASNKENISMLCMGYFSPRCSSRPSLIGSVLPGPSESEARCAVAKVNYLLRPVGCVAFVFRPLPVQSAR